MRMNSRVRRSALIALVASLALFVGCGDEDAPAASPSDRGVACEVVGQLCHEVDSAAGQECHEQAHSGSCSFASCVKLCVPEASIDGADLRCAALGELCHPVADRSDELRECHELGHVNDAGRCAASFDDCAARCIAAREAPSVVPSEGGAGGNGSDSSHEHAAAGSAHHG